MIRVIIPHHLRTLAGTGAEVTVEVSGPATQRALLDALEARYPVLRGTIRDHATQERRAFLRFFAGVEDLSHESPDAPLPEAVAAGKEAFRIIGAIAGGGVSESYKPEGYTSVAPYLIVSGAGNTIDFLKHVFDAVELRRFDNSDGTVMHAEVRIDDTVLMLADSTPNWSAMPAHVHVYVRDVDAVYQRALAAGAAAVQEPTKGNDEDKRGGVRDAGGTTWWIATRVG